MLPHERTTPKAKSDRLDLMRATKANLSAVWGLSMAAGLSALLDPPGEPLGDFTDADGVRHQAWRLDDPDRSPPSPPSSPPRRSSSPTATTATRRPSPTATRSATAVPGAAATLCYVVELAPEQLAVRPIHRLVSGLPSGTDVVAALVDGLRRRRAAGAADDLALVHAARDAPGSSRRDDDGTIETVRLDTALAALPDHELAYQHDADVVVDSVRAGKADAGVLLRPVTVEQIAAVADARDRMPPKTTFFWPKPRTGIVFRSLAK